VDVKIRYGYPVTVNNPDLTEKMLPVLRRVVGEKFVAITPPITASEDFSYYAREIPGFFYFLGVNPPGADPKKTAPAHSPYFFADESSILIGIRTMANLVAAYLEM
jgi:amidohydrolase